jgi:hypothetical protein
MIIDDPAPFVEAADRWAKAQPDIRQTEVQGPLVESAKRKEAFLQHQQNTSAGEAMWAGRWAMYSAPSV